jgi:polysaccharide biosynthesis protein PelF
LLVSEPDPGVVLTHLDWWSRRPADVASLSSDRRLLRQLRVIAPKQPLVSARRWARHARAALAYLVAIAVRPLPACDVVHCTNSGMAAVPALVAFSRSHTPYVLSEHGSYVREAYLAHLDDRDAAGRLVTTRLAVALARTAFTYASGIYPVTRAHLPWELRLGAAPDRILPVDNGVVVPDAPAAPAGTGLVVTVGRGDQLKDVLTLLRVAASVRTRRPGVRFLHVGPWTNADYRRRCQDLHQQLGLGDNFRFVGPSPDVRLLLTRADVVLFTSVSEGLPFAVLEAMAAARPVVSTDVGGIADALGDTTWVTSPGDVDGLARRVVSLLDDPARGQDVGERLWSRAASHFDRRRMVTRHHAALIAALNDHSLADSA